jgi:hypothetical protein
MAYSDFTLVGVASPLENRVKQQFKLNVSTCVFFTDLPKLSPRECLYGSVTTGTFWQFLKLTGQDLTIDVTEYSLNPVERILGILKWTIDSQD